MSNKRGHLKDLQGQTFDFLTVKGLGPYKEYLKDPEPQWYCDCSNCGKIDVLIDNKYLKSKVPEGRLKSCGCLGRRPKKDLTGESFGSLVVISPVKISGKLKWMCRCGFCGNLKSFNAGALPFLKSCGCQKIDNICGQRFGKLTVIEDSDKRNKEGAVIWNCLCDCGNKTSVVGTSLRNGQTSSCGCYFRESLSERFTTHKLTDHPLYGVYHGMKQRCYNLNCRSYRNYGARGITVCEEWLLESEGFINFFNWSLSNGYSDGLTIDRMDNNKGYSPENCQWTGYAEQNLNRRNNRRELVFGEITNVKEISKKFGVNPKEIYYRMGNPHLESIQTALIYVLNKQIKQNLRRFERSLRTPPRIEVC